MYFPLLVLLGLLILQSSLIQAESSSNDIVPNDIVPQIYPVHTFKLRNDSRFEFDGKEIVLAGATMHYFRIPREHWKHRLDLLAKSGLNTLFTAIEWSTHEPSKGVYRFTGDEDFIYFIRIADELGLKVVLRPGPFIGEERDLGGYPSWLLWQKQNPSLDLDDLNFRLSVSTYFRELLPRIKPLLAEHGGPVIMLEVTEEEAACDWLMKIFRKRLGPLVMFRTYEETLTDRLVSSPSNVTTLNGWRNASLETLGNLWPDLWKEEYLQLKIQYFNVLHRLMSGLMAGKSIGIGAFHTGTDFGFKAGSTYKNKRFVAYSTSEVDSLVDEDGSIRPFYSVLQMILSSFYEKPMAVPPTPPPGIELGPLLLWPAGSLLDTRFAKRLIKKRLVRKEPATFEELHQGDGFVLYETTIKRNYTMAELHLHTLRDRAQVYVDRKMAGVAYREQEDMRVPLGDVREGALLQILVENMGRAYWGNESPKMSLKGLSVASAVVIDMDLVYDWTMYGLPLDDGDTVHQLVSEQAGGLLQDDITEGTPSLTGVDFVIPKSQEDLGDTYLDMRGWGRGVVFLNGHNLGRYWPDGGSRKGFYVPKSYLRSETQINHLAVLELETLPAKKHVSFRRDVSGCPWTSMCTVGVGMLLMLISLASMLFYGRAVQKTWPPGKRGGGKRARNNPKSAGEGATVET